jgi:ribonuclease P protein component
VFRDPIRSSDRHFTILARPNDTGAARLGLAISKKAAKRAVDRNRLKRLARETFRLRLALPPWDFVVLAKPGAAGANGSELRMSLNTHFERIARRAEARSFG